MTKETTLEGILFAMGDSVERDVLALALEITEEEVDELADALKARYEEEERGIRLLRLGNAYQLCTAEDCYEALIKIAAKPKAPVLTDVVMETLAIIAYKQPVTKTDIEKIRGVSSDHAVNRLVEYGLVEEKGRLNAPGRPILFGTTEEFLRRFRIADAEELPSLSAEQMADIEAEVEAETAAKDAKELVNVEI